VIYVQEYLLHRGVSGAISRHHVEHGKGDARIAQNPIYTVDGKSQSVRDANQRGGIANIHHQSTSLGLGLRGRPLVQLMQQKIIQHFLIYRNLESPLHSRKHNLSLPSVDILE
jgi:hypothetical protein